MAVGVPVQDLKFGKNSNTSYSVIQTKDSSQRKRMNATQSKMGTVGMEV